MDSKALLVSSFRVILALLVGWLPAKYIGSPVAAFGLDLVAAGAIAYWSYYTKKDDPASALSLVMGPLRNFASSVIAFCVTRGWIDPSLSDKILPAAVALFTAFWGWEHKATVKAMRVVPFLLGIMLVGGLIGCTTTSGGGNGGAGAAIGQTIAVGSGFQGGYIATCVTATMPFCSQIKADAKKASSVFAASTAVIARTYEAGGDTSTLLVAFVADAADLQSVILKIQAGGRSSGRSSAFIDPTLVITIAQIGLQVLPQVVGLVQQLQNGVSNNSQLDQLVAQVAKQDAQIQAS